MSVCVSGCPSVCVFTFEVPFKRLFTPISQSWMSNNFRDFESLGKSHGRMWFQVWTFLVGSGLKLPNKKKFFFGWFCLTKHGGNHVSRWIRDWSKGISLILPYFYTFLSFCNLDDYFLFFKKIRFLGILGLPGHHASWRIRDLWSKSVSQILTYF